MPNKQANAGTFKPGQTGNPNGRPKKQVCVTSWLKEYAATKITKQIDVKNLTYAQAAALSAWKAAAKGDLPEYNFIIERIEGKVINPIDMTSKGNEIKPANIFQIISEETKTILARIENGERTERLETNTDIQPEQPGIPRPDQASGA
jgi:hypothetical protein